MISGVAFCPHPPMLVPQVAAGAAPELDDLRAACITAIRAVAAPGAGLVLLGSGPTSVVHSERFRGTLAGFGVDVDVDVGLGERASAGDADGETSDEAAPDLPLSLTIGAWLVGQALETAEGTAGISVGPDFAGSQVAADLSDLVRRESVALIVMGDGSARRTTAAPGYLDDRAAGFDAAVAAALAEGDPAGLLGVDLDLGAELLAAGPPAWRAAGQVLAGQRFCAELTYERAPYGVGYFVAAWHPRD